MLRRNRGDRGQGLVEYVLIIVLVAVLMVSALVMFQGGLSTAFESAVSALNNAM